MTDQQHDPHTRDPDSRRGRHRTPRRGRHSPARAAGHLLDTTTRWANALTATLKLAHWLSTSPWPWRT